MPLKCRKCRQRDIAFDGVKGLCPKCQHVSDMTKPPHRRGRNDKVALLIQSKVSPGRVPMTGYLLLFLATVAGAAAVEVVRFFAEQTRAHQWAAYLAGDGGYDPQILHGALSTINTTNTLRLVGYVGVLLAYQRWSRVGHANAMTRSDIGLGWIRALPGGTGVVWTYALWFLSVFAALFFMVASGSNNPTDASGYETAANIDSGYCLIRIAVAVLLGVFVVQLNVGLGRLLATPTPAPGTFPTQGAMPAQFGITAQIQVPTITDAVGVADGLDVGEPAADPA